MGWAEKRVKEYQKGQKASFLELRVLEHANSVHMLLSIPYFALLLYGLWIHNIQIIILACIIAIIAHSYCWLQN